MTSLPCFPADSLIDTHTIERWLSMFTPPRIGIRPLSGRRWLIDMCCERVWLDDILTAPQASAALDEALDAFELARLADRVEAA